MRESDIELITALTLVASGQKPEPDEMQAIASEAAERLTELLRAMHLIAGRNMPNVKDPNADT